MTRNGRMMGRVVVGVLAVGLATALGAACDDGAGGAGGSGATGTGGAGGKAGGCATDPFACADGTVCAFTDVQGSKLECLPSGPGAKGDACQNIVNKPACGDDLVCLQLQGEPGGSCVSFCDASHPCDEGACSSIQTPSGTILRACVTPSTSTTSSSSGSTTSASSSSASGSSTSTGSGN